MAEPIQHVLIDPALHLAVLADHVARQAAYTTTYDDGTTGETIHMLYWNEQDQEVQSMPIADWPAQ